MTLLVLITLPALVAWEHPSPFGVWVVVFAQGILTTGLFATSRHPNLFFEQAQWWAFYALGASAAVGDGLGSLGGVINPSIIGAVLLTLLFLGSTVFDRVDLGGEVPRLRRVSAQDVDARPAPPPARQLSRPPEASR